MAVRRHRRPGAEQHLFVSYSPKDMLNGCQSLSAAEEIAYRRLCDLIYVTGDRLIDDDALAEATRVGADWPAVRASLIRKKKVRVTRGRITNDRCQKEIAAATARKTRAKVAANARHGDTNDGGGNDLTGKGNVTSSNADCDAQGLPTNNEERRTKKEGDNPNTENQQQAALPLAERAPRGAPSDYAFAGAVVRLTWKDFGRWTEAYRNIDLRAELQRRDDWLRTIPEADPRRTKWFVPTSSWLATVNREAAERRRDGSDYDPTVLH